MEVIQQGLNDVINLNDFICTSLNHKLIATGNYPAFRKGRGQFSNVLVFNSKEIYKRDIFEGNNLFNQPGMLFESLNICVKSVYFVAVNIQKNTGSINTWPLLPC